VDRIRRAIARNPKERLTALLHHITVEALRRAYDEAGEQGGASD
jgi:hypothetical protein